MNGSPKTGREARTPPAGRIENAADFASAFSVSRETVEKLTLYAELLKNWQKAVNLVSPTTIDQIWHRHFVDSAQILTLVPDAKRWVDLGSGGGFPGLVIAILLANHKDRTVHLIESNGRKCAFLSDVVRRTKAPAIIHHGRIEQIAASGRVGEVDLVTSRALAPLNSLLGLACGFFGDKTRGLFLKGREVDQELADARLHWQFEFERWPSRTDGDGCIVGISALMATA